MGYQTKSIPIKIKQKINKKMNTSLNTSFGDNTSLCQENHDPFVKDTLPEDHVSYTEMKVPYGYCSNNYVRTSRRVRVSYNGSQRSGYTVGQSRTYYTPSYSQINHMPYYSTRVSPLVHYMHDCPHCQKGLQIIKESQEFHNSNSKYGSKSVIKSSENLDVPEKADNKDILPIGENAMTGMVTAIGSEIKKSPRDLPHDDEITQILEEALLDNQTTINAEDTKLADRKKIYEKRDTSNMRTHSLVI